MKLHLGCGERYLEGYTHIDLADFEHIDYKMPVDNLSIFENNSIDEIYASHVVEYFDRDEVKLLLKEWNRVLICLLYTSPSPRDATLSRMPSSA